MTNTSIFKFGCHKRVIRTVAAAVALCVVGCGESTEDRFLQMAKSRAARTSDDDEEETVAEAEVPPPAAPAVEPAPAPAPTAAPMIAQNPEQPSTPASDETAPLVPLVSPGEPPAAMSIDSSGRVLAFDRGDGTVGIFDLEKKQLVRTLGGDGFAPKHFVLDPGGRQLFAADAVGNVEEFSIGQVEGLDVFERRRRRTQAELQGRFAHVRPVTALSAVGYGGGYVTADDRGELKVWGAKAPSLESVAVEGAKILELEEFGGGKFIFAGLGQGEKGKVVFWKIENGSPVAGSLREHVTLEGVPTRMTQTADGRGLGVGDSSGRITLWLPDNGKIRKTAIKPFTSPVSGLAILSTEKDLVAADQLGNLRHFKLPVVERRTIDLPSVDTELLAVDERDSFLLVATAGSIDLINQSDAKRKLTITPVATQKYLSAVSLAAGPSKIIAAATDAGSMNFVDSVSGRLVGRAYVGGKRLRMSVGKDSRTVAFSSDAGRFGMIGSPSESISLASSVGSSILETDNVEDYVLTVSSENRLARVYDAANGHVIGTTSLASLPGNLPKMALHKGVALFGADDGSLWIWHCNQPRSRPVQITRLSEGDAIVAIEIADDGNARVADRKGNLRIVDLTKSTPEIAAAQVISKFAASAEFVSLGAGTIATASGSQIELIADGATEPVTFQLAKGKIKSICVAPASMEAIVVNDEGDVWLANKTGLGEPLLLPNGFRVKHASWIPRGDKILLADSNRIVTFDGQSRRLISEHDEPAGIAQLAARINGSCVLADAKGMVRRRELASLMWSVDDPVRINDFAWNNEKLLAATETGQLWEIDAATGSVAAAHQITDQSLASIAAFASGQVLVIEDESGQVLDCSNPTAPKAWNKNATNPAVRLFTRVGQNRFAVLYKDGVARIFDILENEGTSSPIEVEGEIENLQFLDFSTVAVKERGKLSLQIVPIDGNGIGLGTQFKVVNDLIAVPGSQAIAIADGTSSITLIDLESKASKVLPPLDGMTFDRLAASASGASIAAISSLGTNAKAANSVAVWNLKQPEAAPTQISLSSPATTLLLSADGAQLYVGCRDNTVRTYSTVEGAELERSSIESTPISIDAASTNLLWIGTESGQVLPISLRLSEYFPASESSVRMLRAIQNKLLLVATDKEISVRSLEGADSSEKEPILLKKGDVNVLSIAIRPDAKAIAICFATPAPRIDIWRFGGTMPWGTTLEPSLSVPLSEPSDAIEFVSDSKLMVGQRSGLIQLFDLSNQKPAFKFVGHQSPVAAMTIISNGNQLLSCSSDRSVRNWTLPAGSLQGMDGAIPESISIASAELSEVVAESDADSDPEQQEDDAFAEVRQALLTGSGKPDSAEVFSLFNDDDSTTGNVAEKFEKLKRLEDAASAGQAEGVAAVAALVSARKDFHEQRSRLSSLQRAAGGNTLADNQPNLLFNTQTKFNFSGGVRMVEPQISDGRFVYAVMPPGAQQPGELFVWDFGFSGVQTHAWDDLKIRVSELISLPDGRGVLTMPDLHVFSQNGTSRSIAEAIRYAVSSDDPPYSENRLFAIANRGIAGKEAVALQVFRSEELLHQSAEAVASFSGFESEVTAMAFANLHRAIAFSVRERTGYRVLLADPTTFEPRSITLVAEGKMGAPWLFPVTEEGVDRAPGPAGPVTLAFSPDDRLLLVHSQISEEKYSYSVYEINWPDDALPNRSQMNQIVGPIERDGPFFDMSTNRPLFFVTRTLLPADREKKKMTFASSKAVAFRSGDELQVVDSVTGASLRKIPLLSSSGVARYSITKDGQWVVTADDRGYVKIGNLITGKVVDLTADGRPAHAGPIVGVSISDTDASLQLPEYVVTVGEENRIKVWDILSRLK
jgi:WD40 repeat protein